MLIAYCICSSAALSARNMAPWLGNVYEFQASGSYQHQAGGKIASRHHLGSDLAKASLLFVPDPNWSTELEFFVGRSTDSTAGFDSALFTVRYLLLNDVIGDLASVTAGLSLAQNSHRFMRDLLFMHHGRREAELHLAIGKEFGKDEAYYLHPWAAVFYGIAHHSSPWVRAELHFDTLVRDTHLVALFLQADKGLGSHRLSNPRHFQGYSHINYYLVDLGFTYQYSCIGYGSAFVTLKKRLHARSCPRGVISIEIGLTVPFSF
jgi:hypothetical protein